MNLFLSSFDKIAAEKSVSSVAVLSGNKLLMGKRNDNGKWTCPGGHLNKGEDPLVGALRELKEETGIIAKEKDLTFLNTIKFKRGEDDYTIHGFKMDASTSGLNVDESIEDPDDEVDAWKWIEKNPLPKEVASSLHVPFKENVLFPHVGVSKTAAEALKGGKADRMSDSAFNKKQLSMGIKIEREHIKPIKKRKEIAKDHLTEDPKYYTHLKKMEAKYAGFFGAFERVCSNG